MCRQARWHHPRHHQHTSRHALMNNNTSPAQSAVDTQTVAQMMTRPTPATTTTFMMPRISPGELWFSLFL